MPAVTGDGALTCSAAAITGAGLRHVFGTGVLQALVPTLTVVTLIPDPSIWEASDEEWGQADFVHSEAKPIMIVGTGFYQADEGVSFGERPIEVSLTRTGLAIVGQDRFGMWQVEPAVDKLVTNLWPLMRGSPGTVVQLWVGSQETSDGSVMWEGPYNFRIGVDKVQDFLVSGPYVAVRFTSQGQLPWELMAYELDLVQVGERTG